MNPIEAFEVGIAPQHVPALLAAMLLPLAVFAVRRLRGPVMPMVPPVPTGDPEFGVPRAALRGSGALVDRWAAWLLGIAAVVHLALPLGHFDGIVLAVAFLADGAALGWLALRAWEGRPWRLWSALLLTATLVAYLSVAASGREEPDQVGVATALVELTALALCLIPVRRPRRLTRGLGAAGTVFAVFVVGALIWVGSFVAHAATPAQTGSQAVGHSGDHAHGHDHAARAQAGVIMRPVSDDHHATAQQQAAAEELAAATRTAMARYERLDDAIEAGYALPDPHRGPDVHLENKAYKSDGLVLDPTRPEMLVYAIDGGRATLLGVVFVMEEAGVAGPEPGGPITRWHAHNICLTALPLGFGVVSPFGSCPALSVTVTTPEMMHVWVVRNPAGWFAEGLDKQWVDAYHASHGVAFPAR